MSESERSIELEVEVPGTPDEVWRAIATGPGISSWYVPHVVDEREGGAAQASFGDAPEMQVPGRVAAWEPPHRIVFDGGEGVGGLAFEWLVEARDGGTCIVRLVNSGFGDGGEWDDQYDAMVEGWQLFLFNLQLHCRHFLGRDAVSMLPMGVTGLSRAEAWATLSADLRIPAAPAVGDRIEADAGDGLGLAGTVVRTSPSVVALLLDEPAPGTAFLAVEPGGEGCGVSIWSYLYGPDAPAIIERDKPRWQAWLDARSGKLNGAGRTVLAMNSNHDFCGSDEWREMVRELIIPWALGDGELGDDVLEVGPGFGATTEVFRERVAQLTTVEIDPRLAARLTERFAGTNVVVVEGDATDLAFPDDRFSGATCFSMLHHVPGEALQDRLFAEVARVLRPGGAFVATDSLGSDDLRAYHEGDTYEPVDPAGLADRLAAAGFQDIDVEVNDYGWAARATA